MSGPREAMMSGAAHDNPPPLGTSERAHAAGHCITCLVAMALIIVAVVVSFVYLDLGYRSLMTSESLRLMGRFVADFFPPDLSADFLAKTAWATLQTLAVSALGTLLALAAGAALALPASGRFGPVLRQVSRVLLDLLRGVPELVWAVLMVLVAGLGPFAGVLALGLHTSGVLGRLFAEALENAPPEPENALLNSGSSSVAAFSYGSLPLVQSQWLAYTLYRWEMNIRMAAVLGFVGAGGLGQMLYFHLSLLQQQQAATVLAAICVLVILVDVLSSRWRQGLAPAHG